MLHNTSKLLYPIVVIVILLGCNKAKLEDVDQLTDLKVYPIEKATDVTYIYSDSSIIKAKLLTPYMEKFEVENPYIEMAKGLEVTFYNSEGVDQSYLKANYGIRYIEKKMTEVEGNVVVVNIDGDTLTTEHLIWDEKRDKVFSEKFVRVRTEDEIIKSEGFESDPSFSEYRFKNIKGIINLHESDETNDQQ